MLSASVRRRIDDVHRDAVALEGDTQPLRSLPAPAVNHHEQPLWVRKLRTPSLFRHNDGAPEQNRPQDGKEHAGRPQRAIASGECLQVRRIDPTTAVLVGCGVPTAPRKPERLALRREVQAESPNAELDCAHQLGSGGRVHDSPHAPTDQRLDEVWCRAALAEGDVYAAGFDGSDLGVTGVSGCRDFLLRYRALQRLDPKDGDSLPNLHVAPFVEAECRHSISTPVPDAILRMG